MSIYEELIKITEVEYLHNSLDYIDNSEVDEFDILTPKKNQPIKLLNDILISVTKNKKKNKEYKDVPCPPSSHVFKELLSVQKHIQRLNRSLLESSVFLRHTLNKCNIYENLMFLEGQMDDETIPVSLKLHKVLTLLEKNLTKITKEEFSEKYSQIFSINQKAGNPTRKSIVQNELIEELFMIFHKHSNSTSRSHANKFILNILIGINKLQSVEEKEITLLKAIEKQTKTLIFQIDNN